MDHKVVSGWRFVGDTVLGKSHERSGLKNQDAIACSGGDGSSDDPTVILALSDGHGSPKCFRSDIGSQFAVDCAVGSTREFLTEMLAKKDFSEIRNAVEELLPAKMVNAWKVKVNEHFEQNPFTEEELRWLDQEVGATAHRTTNTSENHFLAYGATLLLSVFTAEYIFYFQLGDGDFLTVSGKTQQVETPLIEDESLIANETTSLCMNEAEKLFRFKFQDIREDPPALILASTDGYSNSFATTADFHKVGGDLFNLIQLKGLPYVQGSLKNWLNEVSSSGSGDDITLGIVCSKEIISNGTH